MNVDLSLTSSDEDEDGESVASLIVTTEGLGEDKGET